MSTYAVEAALHQLSTDRNARSEYKVDAAKFLDRYLLDEGERRALESSDVGAMLAMGVSPLLTYGFWMTTAQTKTRAAYMAALLTADKE